MALFSFDYGLRKTADPNDQSQQGSDKVRATVTPSNKLLVNKDDFNERMEQDPELRKEYNQELDRFRQAPQSQALLDQANEVESDSYVPKNTAKGGLVGGAAGALASLIGKNRSLGKAGIGAGLGAAGLGTLTGVQSHKQQESMRNSYENMENAYDDRTYVQPHTMMAHDTLQDVYEDGDKEASFSFDYGIRKNGRA